MSEKLYTQAEVDELKAVIRSNERLGHGLANGDCVPGDAYRDLAAELASARFVLAERDKEIVWFGEELERRVKAARADAWDEGHGTHRQSGRPCDHFNPYRGDR